MSGIFLQVLFFKKTEVLTVTRLSAKARPCQGPVDTSPAEKGGEVEAEGVQWHQRSPDSKSDQVYLDHPGPGCPDYPALGSPGSPARTPRQDGPGMFLLPTVTTHLTVVLIGKTKYSIILYYIIYIYI